MSLQWHDVPVYMHREPVDFRKSINGLSVIVEEAMEMNIYAGGIFVFCNRQGDKLKVLYWDRTGFSLWYKRLEAARFAWPKDHTDAVVEWTVEEFEWLLQGVDVMQIRKHKALDYQ